MVRYGVAYGLTSLLLYFLLSLVKASPSSGMQALQQLLARVGGPKVHMRPGVESALGQVAEDLVGQALSFGCSMARRRQAAGATAEDLQLQPADLAAFLEQAWYTASSA